MLLAQSLMGHVPLLIQFLVFLQFFLSTATHLLSTGLVMNLPLGIALVLASVYMAQTLCPLCVSYRLVYLPFGLRVMHSRLSLKFPCFASCLFTIG